MTTKTRLTTVLAAAIALTLCSFVAATVQTGAAENPWRNPRPLMLLGIERLSQGDFREALPLLEWSVRLDPFSKQAHAWLAHALHLQRRLDEAALHYRQVLAGDPVQAVDAARREAILRFAPRVYQVASDPFGLLDAVAIHHPDEPLIAYHFFWKDDIDFPADNDPCDHEVVWVRYDPGSMKLTGLHTYFHGRILSSPASVDDALRNGGRPRVNVQWGKHGSMPHGWETLSIQATAGDIERQYLDLQRPQTLEDYNRATHRKLHRDGREHADHPRTRAWPARFEGAWEDFVRFDKSVDLAPHLRDRGMMAVSRWNSATLQQNFLAYNFRPKTEWPDSPGAAATISAQIERRLGATGEQIMSLKESVEIRRSLAADPDPFLASVGKRAKGLPLELPPMSLFLPETPRYPNAWLYAPASRYSSYADFIRFVEEHMRSLTYDSLEVGLSEGADLALSVEHLQPWNVVNGLRHAHDIHIRYFWKRLERDSLHRVRIGEGPSRGEFWRVAASVHYEVEHAHPLHADVEICPLCGRTGGYAAFTGNLVERAHDPIGLELLLYGTVRGEVVRMLDRNPLRGLKDSLRLRDADLLLSGPWRDDMNTEAIAILFIP